MRTGRIVLAAFGAALAIKSLLVDLVIAEGRSMLPALTPGSVHLMNRAAYGLRAPFSGRYILRWSLPSPGDIVVFPAPDGVLAVKRVRTVDAGSFTAIGDNTNESYDSRQYGPVPTDAIIGRIMERR